jgi:type II secretory pathway pseudopilin PulG
VVAIIGVLAAIAVPNFLEFPFNDADRDKEGGVERGRPRRPG